MKRAYAETPEGQVHYATEGTGEPLLLLHHSCRSWTYYRHLIPLLAQRRRVIAMDTLGFGGSDEAPQGFDIEDYARNVIHVLDTLGLAATDIWGASTGAVIATAVAAKWPDRVRRLVFMNYPYFLTEEERRAHIGGYEKQPPAIPREDGSHCIDAWRMARSAYPPESAGSGLSQQDFQMMTDYTLDFLKAGRHWAEIAIRVHSYDKAPRLALIQAPTLVLQLSADTSLEHLKRGAEVKALIPHGSFATVEGSLSTATYGAKAESLARIVLGFLG